jgi:hypothetical protein
VLRKEPTRRVDQVGAHSVAWSRGCINRFAPAHLALSFLGIYRSGQPRRSCPTVEKAGPLQPSRLASRTEKAEDNMLLTLTCAVSRPQYLNPKWPSGCRTGPALIILCTRDPCLSRGELAHQPLRPCARRTTLLKQAKRCESSTLPQLGQNGKWHWALLPQESMLVSERWARPGLSRRSRCLTPPQEAASYRLWRVTAGLGKAAYESRSCAGAQRKCLTRRLVASTENGLRSYHGNQRITLVADLGNLHYNHHREEWR